MCPLPFFLDEVVDALYFVRVKILRARVRQRVHDRRIEVHGIHIDERVDRLLQRAVGCVVVRSRCIVDLRVGVVPCEIHVDRVHAPRLCRDEIRLAADVDADCDLHRIGTDRQVFADLDAVARPDLRCQHRESGKDLHIVDVECSHACADSVAGRIHCCDGVVNRALVAVDRLDVGAGHASDGCAPAGRSAATASAGDHDCKVFQLVSV